MSQPVASPNSRRTIALAATICAVLDVALQYGLSQLSGRVTSPMPWLLGTPLVYTLVALIGAFCASGGLARFQARSRGTQVGTIGAIGGVILATLTLTALTLISAYTPGPTHLGVRFPDRPDVLDIFLAVVILGPPFLVSNLLGLGLAAVAGSLGGILRGRVSGAK